MADKKIVAGVEIQAGVKGLEQVARLGDEVSAAGIDVSALTREGLALSAAFEKIEHTQNLIAQFKALKDESRTLSAELATAQQRAQELALSLKSNPGKKLERDFKSAADEVRRLKARQAELAAETQKTRAALDGMGVSTKNFNAANKQLAADAAAAKSRLQSLNAEASRLKKVAEARIKLGLNVDTRVRGEILQITQAYRTLEASGTLSSRELARATELHRQKVAALKTELSGVPSKLNPIAASFKGFGGSMTKVGAVIAATAYAVKKSVGPILDTTKEFEAIRKRFEYAFGGAAEAAAQLEFVRETANRLGLDLIGAANGYSQLASATKNLNMPAAQTQQIFSGVASAVAAMGLSASDANGVFLALSQIAGKGKVSMEELRQQLGERLTPAMAIAAQSMGVTTAELEKMVENGISAEKFLPRFGAALEQAFAADAAKNIDTLNGQINLLQNKFKDLLNDFGEGGVADGAITVLQDVGEMLDWLKEQIDGMDATVSGGLRDTFVSAYEAIKEAFAGVADLVGTVVETIDDVGGAISTLAGGSGEDFDIIKGAIDGINIAIGAIRDTISVVQIAFDLFIGAALDGTSLLLKGLSKITFGEVSENFEKAAADLEESAKKHYQNAEDAALQFESKTVAAANRAIETEGERFARLEAYAKDAYQQATTAAIEAAKKAREAQDEANAAIGTAAEDTARKQADEATKAAGKAQYEAQKTEKAWREAYAKIGNDADVIAEITQPLREAGLAVDEATQKVQKLPPALTDAKGAAQELGLNIRAAMNEPTPALAEMSENIGKLRTGFDAMKSAGIDAGSLIRQAMANMVKTAQNEADIRRTQDEFKKLGQEGKLSMREVEQGIADTNARLSELKADIDPVTQAFKRLGIQTKEALAASAQSLINAFETAKESGQASVEELQKGFEKAANAAIASGDQQAMAWARANAGAHGYTVTIDDIGKAAIKSADEVQAAASRSAEAHRSAGKAAADAQGKAAAETENAGKAAGNAAREYGKLTLKLFDASRFSAEAAQNLRDAFGAMSEGAYLSATKARVDQYYNDIQRAAAATESLTRKTQAGTVSLSDIAAAAAAGHSSIAKLDSATLNSLHAAIDAAKQKLQALRDEAAATRAGLEQEFAQLKGDADRADQIEAAQKLKALNDKLNEARASGDQVAIANYERSLGLQRQIYAEKARQRELDAKKAIEDKARAEEEAREREAAEEARRREEEAARAQKSDAVIKIDGASDLKLEGLGDAADKIAGMLESALSEQEKQIMQRIIPKLLDELRNAMKRMGR